MIPSRIELLILALLAPRLNQLGQGIFYEEKTVRDFYHSFSDYVKFLTPHTELLTPPNNFANSLRLFFIKTLNY